MGVKDHHGQELSGASPAAAEKFQQALHAYHCYSGDSMPLLAAALADSPGFVMAHVLTAYMTLIGSNAETQTVGVEAFGRARDLPANGREQGHVAAIGSLLAGETRAAARILEDVTLAHPRDVLALQVAQMVDLFDGETRMLRDRIARALPAWGEGMPDHHAVLGMLAFGLEETGHYDRAEAAGRRAIELEPRDNWAQHAVAHVLTMQGRSRDGVAWMTRENSAWAQENLFGSHNWWHLALFHLDLGDTEAVLKLYDEEVRKDLTTMAFEMIDSAALLWRLKLRGVDVGGRFARLADDYATEPRGRMAFDDAHAMMAFVGAGREAEASALIEAQAAAAARPGDNAEAARQVGLPLCQALHAFGRGDHARAVELLRGLRGRSARLGGSHAQRDLIDLTLIAAAGRSGDVSLERALLAERAEAQPLARAQARAIAA